jgi:hypothetical protein
MQHAAHALPEAALVLARSPTLVRNKLFFWSRQVTHICATGAVRLKSHSNLSLH